MPRLPFVGGAYSLRTIRAECQNCINFYPEVIESGTGKDGERALLLQVPGLRRLATVGAGPIRGLYKTSAGNIACVSGNKLYSINSSWVATEVGTLNTSQGIVDMSDNGVQIVIVDGNFGYIASMVTGAFQRITSESFLPATRVAFCDGYFIFEAKGTNQFFISSLYDGTTYDGSDFGVAEGLPDPVVSVVVNQRQLWVAGSKSIEVYWNSGDVDFPFSRIDGSFQEFGCAAPHTLQKVGGTVMWLSDSYHVLMAEGYAPRRVSNYAVEYAIKSSGDMTGAYAWTYKQEGHIFYALQLPGASSTWVYDYTTQTWHERCEISAGILSKSRISCAIEAFNEVVCGDSSNGKIYALDFNVFDNDGDVLVRERTAPHVSGNMLRINVNKFQLDIDGGQGLSSGLGSNPKIMLKISKDGGYIWGTEHWASAGPIGHYKYRAIWRQLGQARDWVFRVRITDPIRANLMGADIDIQQAVS